MGTKGKIIVEKNMKPKLIVVVGPTASGKTGFSIKLAKKIGAEIISADSRQVYKGMDIGSGKITKKEMKGIPHYLLDMVSPKRKFSVARYKKLALKAIEKILKKRKIPILCGGTGFYIQAITDGLIIPKVKPDWKLRKKLEKNNTEELFEKLKKLDLKRAKLIDKNNKRRLIRSLEIVIKTKKPIPPLKKNKSPFEVLMIGVKINFEKLKKMIKERLLKRFKIGMVAEVKKLKKSGLSWKRLEEFGLEYKFVARYLQKKITKEEMTIRLEKEIEHYAKRQMTWFKKDKRIHWVENYQKAEKLIKEFLKNK